MIVDGVLKKRGDKSKELLESCGMCFGHEAHRLGLVD